MFVTAGYFPPGLIFEGKAGVYKGLHSDSSQHYSQILDKGIRWVWQGEFAVTLTADFLVHMRTNVISPYLSRLIRSLFEVSLVRIMKLM